MQNDSKCIENFLKSIQHQLGSWIPNLQQPANVKPVAMMLIWRIGAPNLATETGHFVTLLIVVK